MAQVYAWLCWAERSREQAERKCSKASAGTQGQQIIDKATYSKLVKEFLNDGGIIIRGEEADRFLEKQRAYASYLVGSKIAFIRDGATVSDVLEEMYHAKQDRRGDYNNLIFDEMILSREIDAQK